MNKLTDTSLEELIKAMSQTKTGAIPTNMIYWSKAQDPNLWANVATTTNTWEIEVDFND